MPSMTSTPPLSASVNVEKLVADIKGEDYDALAKCHEFFALQKCIYYDRFERFLSLDQLIIVLYSRAKFN